MYMLGGTKPPHDVRGGKDGYMHMVGRSPTQADGDKENATPKIKTRREKRREKEPRQRVLGSGAICYIKEGIEAER